MKPLVSPDLLEKSRKAQIANLLKKQARGKALTEREQRLIEDASQQPKKITKEGNAPTWQALAAALGITYRGLVLVRTRYSHDPDLPRTKANSSHSIDDWRSFFERHNIEGKQMDADANGNDEASPAVWKARQIEQQVIKLKLANELTKRQQVPMSEVQEKLSACLMAIRTEINQITPDLAQSLEGIDDYHEREEIIEARINKALLALQNAPWLDEQPLELEEKS